MARQSAVNLKRWESKTGQAALATLAKSFSKNGYWRGKKNRKIEPETHRGYEARFSALTIRERDTILRLLRVAGLSPGKPFAKGPSWRIPVYGKAPVQLLRSAMWRLQK